MKIIIFHFFIVIILLKFEGYSLDFMNPSDELNEASMTSTVLFFKSSY